MATLHDVATSARFLASLLRERFPIQGEDPPKRRANRRALVQIVSRLELLRMFLPDQKAAETLCGPGTTWQQLDAAESIQHAVAEIWQCYGLDGLDGPGGVGINISEMPAVDAASVRDLESAADVLEPLAAVSPTVDNEKPEAKPTDPPATDDEDIVVMGATEAGRYVGVVSKTITNWIREGSLKSAGKIGTKYKLSRAELDIKKEARPKKSAE